MGLSILNNFHHELRIVSSTNQYNENPLKNLNYNWNCDAELSIKFHTNKSKFNSEKLEVSIILFLSELVYGDVLYTKLVS